jgi:hypothetical protein
MTNVKECETLIEDYKIQLENEFYKEVILNEKMKDPRILFSKRQQLIID